MITRGAGWLDRIKYNIASFSDNRKQYYYNQKEFTLLDRIEVLRATVELGLKSRGSGFMTMDLMSELYTLRWIAHPDGHNQEDRLQLFINAFLESGEIDTTDNIRYQVKGKAVNTLSRYEEEERRHGENTKLQRRLVHLTLAIVLVGLLQAYMIRNDGTEKPPAQTSPAPLTAHLKPTGYINACNDITPRMGGGKDESSPRKDK